MPYMLNPLLERGAQSNALVLHCLSVALSLGAQWQFFVRQQQESPAAAPGHAPPAIAAPPSPARSPPGPPLGLGGWGADDEGAGAPLALPNPGAPGAPGPGAAGPPGHGMQPAACLPLQARLPAAPDADHGLAHLLQPVISLPLRPQLPAAPSAPHAGMGAGAGAWAQHEPVGFAGGPGSGPAAVAAAHAPAQQQAHAVGVGAPGDITPGYQGPAQVTGPRASAAAARQALMQRFREDSARLDARIRTASAPMLRSLPDPHVRPHTAGAPAGERPSSTPPVCGIEVPAPAASAQPPAGPPSSQQSPAEGLGGWEAQGAGAAAAAAAGEAESSSMLDFLRQNLLAADAGDVEPPAAAREGPPREGPPRGGPQSAPGAAERAETSGHVEPMAGLGAGPRQGSGLGNDAEEASGHVVQVAAQVRASIAARNGDSAAAQKRPRSPDQGGAPEAQGAAAKAPRLG